MEVVRATEFSCTVHKYLSFTGYTGQYTADERMQYHVIITSPNAGRLDFFKIYLLKKKGVIINLLPFAV